MQNIEHVEGRRQQPAQAAEQVWELVRNVKDEPLSTRGHLTHFENSGWRLIPFDAANV
jgi:hypothetical protein